MWDVFSRWARLAPGLILLATFAGAQTPALQVTTMKTSLNPSAVGVYPGSLGAGPSGAYYVAGYDSTLRKIAPDGTVTILAGSPNQRSIVDGVGTAARLETASKVAVGPGDVVYLSDYFAHVIRKVTPDGTVTTFVGTAYSAPGFADGAGAAVRFNGISGICYDPVSGNLFVADTFNYIIRKVTPGGVVSTYAGRPGVKGFQDGPAASALFQVLGGISCDGAGNLYVVDLKDDTTTPSDEGRIRKIDRTGQVTTIATGLSSDLNIAVNSSGTCYALEYASIVAQLLPSGAVTVAGRKGTNLDADGLGIYATLASASAIAAAPDGTVAVTTWTGLRLGKPVLAPPTAPEIVYEPQGHTGTTPEGPFQLGVSAIGYPDPAYQWYKDGQAIAGATGATLAFPFVTSADNGTYLVVASNSAGSATSTASTITASGPHNDPRAGPPPTFTLQPVSQTVTEGSTVTFTVAATGAYSYGWWCNAVPLSASGPTLTLQNVTQAQSGIYAVAAFNAQQSVSWADPVQLTITPAQATPATAGSARLINISTRAFTASGAQQLAAGFSLSGLGGKTMLVRGIGPALSGFGVPGALASPQLTLFGANGTPLAMNAGWGGDSVLVALMSQVGAFSLPAGSADAALQQTLGGGSYTATVSGAGNSSGVALMEVYDTQPSSATRLVNLSARAWVGTGSNALAAGFVVGGGGTEKLLVRGIGPALSAFGVTGVLPTTQLTVFDGGGHVVASNSGWDGSTNLSSVFGQVGAFALTPGSPDSAVVVQLPTGAYSAQLTGAGGESGIGLIELYEIP